MRTNTFYGSENDNSYLGDIVRFIDNHSGLNQTYKDLFVNRLTPKASDEELKRASKSIEEETQDDLRRAGFGCCPAGPEHAEACPNRPPPTPFDPRGAGISWPTVAHDRTVGVHNVASEPDDLMLSKAATNQSPFAPKYDPGVRYTPAVNSPVGDIVRALAAMPRPEKSGGHGDPPSCMLCGGICPGGPCRLDCPHRMAKDWCALKDKLGKIKFGPQLRNKSLLDICREFDAIDLSECNRRLEAGDPFDAACDATMEKRVALGEQIKERLGAEWVTFEAYAATTSPKDSAEAALWLLIGAITNRFSDCIVDEDAELAKPQLDRLRVLLCA